jgi:hypothetical protein
MRPRSCGLILLPLLLTACGLGGHAASQSEKESTARPRCGHAVPIRQIPGAFNSWRPGYVAIPQFGFYGIGSAVAKLRDLRLRVSLPHGIPAQPAGIDIDEAGPVVSRPAPGTEVALGSTVRLTVVGGHAGIPSPAVPVRHPARLVVPRLVGLTLRETEGCADGFWLAFDTAPPLSARATLRAGIDAYVVATQRPGPGAVLPWGGTVVVGGGYQPTIVTVSLRPRLH